MFLLTTSSLFLDPLCLVAYIYTLPHVPLSSGLDPLTHTTYAAYLYGRPELSLPVMHHCLVVNFSSSDPDTFLLLPLGYKLVTTIDNSISTSSLAQLLFPLFFYFIFFLLLSNSLSGQTSQFFGMFEIILLSYTLSDSHLSF